MVFALHRTSFATTASITPSSLESFQSRNNHATTIVVVVVLTKGSTTTTAASCSAAAVDDLTADAAARVGRVTSYYSRDPSPSSEQPRPQ